MNRFLILSSLCIPLIICGCNTNNGNNINLQVTSIKPVSEISPLIYGHFFEHIYHSANGGLWGDLVWNRSFEEFLQKPHWKLNSGILSQSEKMSDVKLLFGDPAWTDYTFTLEARKDAGYEGFLILFRAIDEDNFYWLNLGGWGNSQHAIEKEIRNSRSVMSPFIKGRISENEWVPIRVSVKGNRIEAYLNNQLLYNYTDTIHQFLHGAVGIGSWSTAVSYKNLKVTDASGKVLFTGFPEIPGSEMFPRHWTPSDPGRFRVESTGTLNGKYSVAAMPNGKSISISQKNFAVHAGDKISGSVWLKGKPGTTVAVQLKNGNEIISEYSISNLSDIWKEYPILLNPKHDTQYPDLCVSFSGSGQVNIDQISLMPESAVRNSGFRTDLFDAVAAIKPTVIRWPGGCYAELYRWKDGIGPQSKRQTFPENIWDDKDVNSIGTDEYIELSRKLKSEPLIVINTGFHEGAGTPEAWAPWISEACEWVDYCNGPATTVWGAVRAANGHPEPYHVKFWEIDNELWRSLVPDPHKYSQAVKLFAAAMRKIDPSIIVIAHGGNGTDMEWNQVLLNECAADFDVLSIHHYSDPNAYYSAALAQDSLYKKLKASVAACSNPKIRIYVSEWNAQSTDWRTGLYAGNLLNIFEQNSDIISMGGPALFLRHTTASAWDNAFINFNESGWFPAPNYVVMKLWRDHFAPERLGITGMPDSVNAIASFDPADGRLVIKLVNNSKTDKPITVSLPDGCTAANAQGYLVKGNSLTDRNTMKQPEEISPKNQAVTLIRKKISTNLPGLSCLLIEVK